MLVYRDSAECHASAGVIFGLRASLAACLASPANQDFCIDALLRAGELECALADLAATHALEPGQVVEPAAAEDAEGGFRHAVPPAAAGRPRPGHGREKRLGCKACERWPDRGWMACRLRVRRGLSSHARERRIA